MGFFDNMQDRPIIDASWRDYQIVGDVADDAEEIALGLMMFGNGRVWLDAVSFEIVGKIGEGDEPARPLEGRGLDNLVAFTRLLGYVRYFHPSDQAAATDWDRFAIDGVRAVEGAKDPEALVRVLEHLFRPIAPSVRIFPTGKPPANVDAKPRGRPHRRRRAQARARSRQESWPGGTSASGWAGPPCIRASGVDLRMPQPIFGPKLPDMPLPRPRQALRRGPGRRGLLPGPDCAQRGRERHFASARPRSDQAQAAPRVAPRPPGFQPSGKDRATRLGAVALAWNVFQHFYPYFDVVEADWPAELRRALTRAAEDADERAFIQTLAAWSPRCTTVTAAFTDPVRPPRHRSRRFGWDWVEGQLVVTGVAAQGAGGLKPGDVVVEIDGKPTAEVLAEHEAMISGATSQWRRDRALTRGRGRSP